MQMAEFIEWCEANSEDVDALGAIWHEPDRYKSVRGFFSRSHVVAYGTQIDGEGVEVQVPVQCAQFAWSESLNTANIAAFLGRVRRLIGIAPPE